MLLPVAAIAAILGPALALAAQLPIAALPSLPAPNPFPNQKAVVSPNGAARFTVLTDALIRLEYDQLGLFSDDPSLAVINRHFKSPVHFKTQLTGDTFVLETRALRLVYKGFLANASFSDDSLFIELLSSPEFDVWKPSSDISDGNLHGTVRTLDGYSKAPDLDCKTLGRDDQHCTYGLISRKGWTLLNDSHTPRLEFEPKPGSLDFPWIQKENKNSWSHQDLYFFGHGHNFKGALKDFSLISGKIPMPPRYAFGSWSSRYWAFSDMEFLSLVSKYQANRIPLDILVVDMDWHKAGWTGWSWNPLLFPMPQDFMASVKKHGIKTTVNLHPADGIGSHEDAYPEIAKKLGYSGGARIPFQSTNATFVKEFFGIVIDSLEKDGIDFFWLDWQQGESSDQWTKVAGLNPTIWLNYLFWNHKQSAHPNVRPLNFHRWGGLGNHRFPIGFSGDTYPVWEMLDTQIEFTATASNVLFGYWSHDIGSHMRPCEKELYTRWTQFGAWSPIFRTHSSKQGLNFRYFWKFPRPESDIMTAAVTARIELLPYIYTMSKAAYDTGISILRPLYYEYPEVDDAYLFGSEYYFGDSLVVRPIGKPSDPDTGLVETSLWIPPGTWLDVRSGSILTGPTVYSGHYLLEDVPVLMKSGAIIPKAVLNTDNYMAMASEVPEHVLLDIFFGDALSGSFKMFEDDGITAHYDEPKYALWTDISFARFGDGGVKIKIDPKNGHRSGISGHRTFSISLRNIASVSSLRVNGKNLTKKYTSRFNAETFSTEIELPQAKVSEQLEISITFNPIPVPDGLRGKVQRLLKAKELLDNLYEITEPRVNQEDYSYLLEALSILQTLLYPRGGSANETDKLSDVERLYGVAVQQVAGITERVQGVDNILTVLTNI
ncbi:hypothetical protein HDU84_005098 [Entophlyctis sp. JEL0112]|nr:hypothetical protein HDU84_005098 [Entophlyctis sp. JEL0112]